MSRESDFARRAARFYGPERVQMSRSERIAFVGAEIAREWAAHTASCRKCQEGAFCYTLSTPEQMVCLRFLRRLIRSEQQDEAYAQRARFQPVEYGRHIGGRCGYWQNLRHRKFEAAGWKCEICGNSGPLDAHHLHYDTLGLEELGDLQALCRDCHAHTDTRYSNAMQQKQEEER